MSLTRFKAPSLRDKQELADGVADPRLEKLEEQTAEEAAVEKGRKKITRKKKEDDE